ncbi:MAG: MurR/RpiR family transcriptional regulator [Clostridiales bacterium]|nr:MurR/RpiR family transcriptional regulator [Clostridiales bacterium]
MQDNIEWITEKYDALSKGECAVADYAIAHLHDVVSMSVQELSEAAQVSVATVIRFCKKLGFDGYRSFCIRMAQGMNERVDYVMDLHEEGGNLEERVRRVLLANAETIQCTLEHMDYAMLNRAALAIYKSRHILFVGMGSSQMICQDATLRFLRVGKQAACYADPHAAIVAASHCTKEDTVIAVSHSGLTKEVYEMQRIAKERGATVIGITTYPAEHVGAISDLVLKTYTRESPLHKVAITSRTSQIAVIDALFLAVMNLNPDDAISSVNRVSDNIANMEGYIR